MHAQAAGAAREVLASAPACRGASSSPCTTTPSCPHRGCLRPVARLLCSIQEALALAQDPSNQGEAIRNAFILLGFFIAFRVLVYVLLRRKTAGL